jgi:hypothetical protein
MIICGICEGLIEGPLEPGQSAIACRCSPSQFHSCCYTTIDKLRAENARYRGALEKIAANEIYDGIEDTLGDCIEIAAEALKSNTKEKP